MQTFTRVRFAYPDAFAELVSTLSKIAEVETVSNALKIPKSTVYRWRSESLRRQKRSARIVAQEKMIATVDELCKECEAAGLTVRPAVAKVLANNGNGDATNFGRTASAESAPSPVAHKSLDEVYVELTLRFKESWSISTLAKQTGLTKFELIRRFTCRFGISPYQYLLSVRTKEAVRLLTTTRLSVAAVATLVGFGSQSAMQRAFKKFEGTTPGCLPTALSGIPKKGH